MKFLDRIYKYMKPFLNGHNFVKKGGCFCKIENDLAFCISFELPSSLVYVHYHIIPLYIPTEVRYLTYGNRINNVYHSKLPQLTRSATEQDISSWCHILQLILQEDIFPFFDDISAPLPLLTFVGRDKAAVRKHFFCGEWSISRLRVFTCLYLHMYSKMELEIAQAKKELRNSQLVESLKATLEAELDNVAFISSQDIDYVDAYLSRVSAETMSTCF